MATSYARSNPAQCERRHHRNSKRFLRCNLRKQTSLPFTWRSYIIHITDTAVTPKCSELQGRSAEFLRNPTAIR